MKTPYKYVPVISSIYRSVRQQFRAIKYRGTGVACPICEQEFSSWIDNKPTGTCPGCGSAPRQRLLWLFLKSNTSIFEEPQRLLHFAPEACLQGRFTSLPHLKYTTVDRSAPGVDVYADITNLPFQEGSVDAIVCCHVLEHIPDDRAAMAELYRVLAPGGNAYIQVPYSRTKDTDEDPSVTEPAERQKRFGQFDHVRVYGRDLKQRLEAVGFKASEQYYARTMEPSSLPVYGLWVDVIFWCQKPER